MDAGFGVRNNFNEESELKVALFVVVLEASLVKSVVLYTGQLPWGILKTSICEAVEICSDGLVHGWHLETAGVGAT